MGEGRGGYQPPSNPAPVSGPGALSQRTDVQAPMQMTGGPYGEASEMAELQGGADMFAAASPPPLGLMAPDDRPDIPLTSGIDDGPGAGADVLRTSQAYQKDMTGLNKYMPLMERMAGRVDAPTGFRALVSYIKAANSGQ